MTHGVGGLAFIIVSATHPAHHLDARLESFLQAFIQDKWVITVMIWVITKTMGGVSSRTGGWVRGACTSKACHQPGRVGAGFLEGGERLGGAGDRLCQRVRCR